jgi:protein-tyrosine phosphatase
MAERIAEKLAAEAGLAAVFTSAGTSDEESGNPMDPRAVKVLRAAGYRTSGHHAQQVTPRQIRDADLVVALEPHHLRHMRQLVPDADNLTLLTDFDPAAQPGSGIADPWYGPASGFEVTYDEIVQAMPGLLEWVRTH